MFEFNPPGIPRGADWSVPAGISESRNTRTGRGPARTAGGALKRGIRGLGAGSRGLARTRADWRTRGASHTTTNFW